MDSRDRARLGVMWDEDHLCATVGGWVRPFHPLIPARDSVSWLASATKWRRGSTTCLAC